MSIRVHLNSLCQELPSEISGGGIVIIVLVTGGTAQGLIDHGPHGYGIPGDSFQVASDISKPPGRWIKIKKQQLSGSDFPPFLASWPTVWKYFASKTVCGSCDSQGKHPS